MPTQNSDGSVTYSADEYSLISTKIGDLHQARADLYAAMDLETDDVATLDAVTVDQIGAAAAKLTSDLPVLRAAIIEMARAENVIRANFILPVAPPAP